MGQAKTKLLLDEMPLVKSYQQLLNVRQLAVKWGDGKLQAICQNRMETLYRQIKKRQETHREHREVEERA